MTAGAGAAKTSDASNAAAVKVWYHIVKIQFQTAEKTPEASLMDQNEVKLSSKDEYIDASSHDRTHLGTTDINPYCNLCTGNARLALDIE